MTGQKEFPGFIRFLLFDRKKYQELERQKYAKGSAMNSVPSDCQINNSLSKLISAPENKDISGRLETAMTSLTASSWPYGNGDKRSEYLDRCRLVKCQGSYRFNLDDPLTDCNVKNNCPLYTQTDGVRCSTFIDADLSYRTRLRIQELVKKNK